MLVSFKVISLGASFKLNNASFIKTSSRTARLIDKPHKVFYFSKTELIPYKSVNAPFNDYQ